MLSDSMPSGAAQLLLAAAERLSATLADLPWPDAVHTVYNPFHYAKAPYARYLELFANGHKRVLFLGMNPGPWGMVQTGIPFGEVAAVRNWLGIEERILQPQMMHPKRPITGFQCKRSEVSGRRLWGLFAERFGQPQAFFAQHFVLNYCPLAFMAESGANLTPDKFATPFRRPLEQACDAHLIAVATALRVEWIIGVGAFAAQCAQRAVQDSNSAVKIGTILHPSPASPIANKEWPQRPIAQLQELGLWHSRDVECKGGK